MEGKPEFYSPFRPGMTATVDVITDKREKTVAVAISAIVIKTDTSSTKVPLANKAESGSRPVETEEKFECVFVKIVTNFSFSSFSHFVTKPNVLIRNFK